MTQTISTMRARLAQIALDAYIEEEGPYGNPIVDLVTDLLHLAHQQDNEDPAQVAHSAIYHYRREREVEKGHE